MKTRKIIILMISMLFISAAAFAQPMRSSATRPQRPGWTNGQGMMRRLNLTKEQISKLSDMRLTMQKEMLPLRNKLITLRGDLKLEMIANNYSQNKVNSTVDQIANVRKQMSLKMIQHFRDVRGILTPAQQKKFDLMVLNRGKRGFMRHRPMRNRGNWGMRKPGMMHPGMRPGMWNK